MTSIDETQQSTEAPEEAPAEPTPSQESPDEASSDATAPAQEDDGA